MYHAGSHPYSRWHTGIKSREEQSAEVPRVGRQATHMGDLDDPAANNKNKHNRQGCTVVARGI
jgi:hypothetical protein